MVATVLGLDEPENESERFAIRYLRDNLPDGYCLIHNLLLDAQYKHPYEYDIVVVGKFAVYHIEVKGYRGKIEANKNEWLLKEYNEERKNPFGLAEKKSKVLASLIHNTPQLQNVWVETVVFLTDERASITWVDGRERTWVQFRDTIIPHVTNPQNLSLSSSASHLQKRRIANTKTVLDTITKNTYFDKRRPNKPIRDFVKAETLSSNNLYTSYLAHHQVLQFKSLYKLKVYHFDVYQDQETRTRQKEHVQREATALHTLQNHPHIVQAKLPFWHEGDFVLPLEWVGGVSLRTFIEQKESFSWRSKLRIARQIGKGLRFAHENHIIHRDLRPENIIITPEKEVKIINFDLARIENKDMPTLSISMDIKLHEAYIAPEVWERASNASAQSDMFSWGIVFFELITGHTPYKNIVELIEARQLPERTMALLKVPALPKHIDKFFQRVCAFSVNDRFKSMEDALRALTKLPK